MKGGSGGAAIGAGNNQSRMKVLVADDDPACLRALERPLSALSLEVVTAANGGEAFRLLRESTEPMLAIVDWMMPLMTGPELCEQVRKAVASSYHYIILVTGRTHPEDTVRALTAGADDVMGKPWDLAELLARVRVGERLLRQTGSGEAAFQRGLEEALSGAGGELVVRAGSTVGRVFTHKGRIAWTHLSSEVHPQTSVATQLGIRPEDWKDVVESCTLERENIFQRLIELDLADRERVSTYIRELIARQLLVMARLQGTRTLFLPHSRSYSENLLFGLEELPALGLDSGTASSPVPGKDASTSPSRVQRAVGGGTARTLGQLLAMEGAATAALIDLDSSEVEWANPEHASEFESALSSQSRALRVLGTDDVHGEMIASARGAWHLLVRLPLARSLALYAVFVHQTTTPAMVRLKMRQMASEMMTVAAGPNSSAETLP